MKKVLSGCLDFHSVERKQWRGCDFGIQRAVESTLQVTGMCNCCSDASRDCY